MDPVSFSSETTIYLIWGGIIQLIWAVLAAPFLYLLALRISDKSFHVLFQRYAVFNVFLLLWSCLGSYLFMSIAFGKLYTSVDRLVDWYAFIPFGQWVLDDGFEEGLHGHLIGDATLWQLRFLWLALAIPVWTLAVISTWGFLQLVPRRFSKSQRV